MVTLINPVPRPEPFDHADWLFELKFYGIRAAADTARGRLISRNGDRLRRDEAVLDLLPKGYVFDGEKRKFRVYIAPELTNLFADDRPNAVELSSRRQEG